MPRIRDAVPVALVILRLRATNPSPRIHATAVIPTAHELAAQIRDCECRAAIARPELTGLLCTFAGGEVAGCLSPCPQPWVGRPADRCTVGLEPAGGGYVAGKLHDRAGGLTGAVVIWVDVTERRQLEKQQQALEAQLQRSRRLEAA